MPTTTSNSVRLLSSVTKVAASDVSIFTNARFQLSEQYCRTTDTPILPAPTQTTSTYADVTRDTQKVVSLAITLTNATVVTTTALLRIFDRH